MRKLNPITSNQIELLHLDLEENKPHLISGKNKKKNIWLLLHDHDLELLLLHQIEEEEDLQKKQ